MMTESSFFGCTITLNLKLDSELIGICLCKGSGGKVKPYPSAAQS